MFHTYLGNIEAIDGANLKVQSGEVIAVVGETGCGKTTLARAILGVIPSPPGRIKSGQILFGERDLLAMDEEELNNSIRGKSITLVPQDPFGAFNPLFTIGTQIKDIVGLGRKKITKFRKSRVETEKVEEMIIKMLKTVQLPSPKSFLRKYPHELSGGQLQRVMIATALLPLPKLIIADEPTTFLDVTVQAQIIELLETLVHERNLSVLYITHNLAVASKISDRLIVMYAGQIAEVAPKDSFLTRPSHPYTKKLLECLPSHSGKIEGIPGTVPSLIDPPIGCRFAPRCNRTVPDCFKVRPRENRITQRHFAYCHNPFS
jgi:peptide/nickel transport system ATP-binding protein